MTNDVKAFMRTKGMKVVVVVHHPHNVGRPRKLKFIAGGKLRVDIGDGFIMTNGIARFANGMTAYAILELDTRQGFRRTNIGIFLPSGGVTFSSFPEFLRDLGLRRSDVHPIYYKYRRMPGDPVDAYMEADGWCAPRST